MLDSVDVVVRCRNEMPHTRRTLEALAGQLASGHRGASSEPWARVLFIDCESTDGSRQEAATAGASIIDWDPGAYVPGAVLNFGMERTRSSVVAFVNADAIPLHPTTLAGLIEPLLQGGSVAAVYGRQLSRPDADPLTRLDHARAFPPGRALAARRGAFFSMAASAIRRDVWERLPFDAGLCYSEDVDWVRRAEALGWTVAYAPEASFEHSHSYDVPASFRRRRGEGAADTQIFRLDAPSLITDFARPLAGSLLRDARAGVLSPRGLLTRVAQASGYLAGRRQIA